jgi:hypothetical protein
MVRRKIHNTKKIKRNNNNNNNNSKEKREKNDERKVTATMKKKKMMVEEKKERTKEEKKEEREKKGNVFEISRKGGPVKKKESPPQCLVWFRLNGLSSSQNGPNSSIHNWCIGGCWFTRALEWNAVNLTIK